MQKGISLNDVKKEFKKKSSRSIDASTVSKIYTRYKERGHVEDKKNQEQSQATMKERKDCCKEKL